MGRTLKRVPMDFDYTLNKVWYGYYLKPSFCHETYSAGCSGCKQYAKINNIPFAENGCPDYQKHYNIEWNIEPPKGEGYQLWETTSEGSPQSPVFATLEELSEWCAKYATTCADFKATKEKWYEMLESDNVHHQEGNVIFM